MFDLNGYIEEYGGTDGTYFNRNIFLEIGNDRYDADLQNFKNRYHNRDIYKCIYAYENRDIDSCKLYAPLCFDLDGNIWTPAGFQKVKRDVFGVLVYFSSIGFSMEDIDLYFSGSKGFHVVIPPEVLGVSPDENLNLLYKAWAHYLYNTYNISSLDLGIYDRRRLFRIPGSINSKTGLYKVKITPEFLRETDYLSMIRYAGNVFNTFTTTKERSICPKGAIAFHEKSKPFYEQRNRKSSNEPVKLPEEKQELLPCVKELLNTSISVGNRNNTAIMLASGLFQSGYNEEEIRAVMLDWNDNNCPPLPETEINSTILSAYDMLRSGKKYGCSTYKEFGYCSGTCKVEAFKEEINSGR